jgi:hypothetical protein
MRVKLIVLVTVVASVLACVTWCLYVILVIEEFGLVSTRNGYVLGSLLVLLFFAAASAVFVYRHTAHKRKTQALLALLLTAFLTITSCLTIARFYQRKLLYATPGNWFAG